MKALSLLIRKSMTKVKVEFKQVGQQLQGFKVSVGQKLWYHVKGLVTSNTHVQYESPISSGLEQSHQSQVLKFYVSRTGADADADKSY